MWLMPCYYAMCPDVDNFILLSSLASLLSSSLPLSSPFMSLPLSHKHKLVLPLQPPYMMFTFTLSVHVHMYMYYTSYTCYCTVLRCMSMHTQAEVRVIVCMAEQPFCTVHELYTRERTYIYTPTKYAYTVHQYLHSAYTVDQYSYPHVPSICTQGLAKSG